MKESVIWERPLYSLHHTRTERPDRESFERHCHDRFELLYVVQGEGRYAVEGVEYPLRDNTAILLYPFKYHYIRPDEHTPYERYVIHFSASFLEPSLRALPILNRGDGGEHGIYFAADSMESSFAVSLEALNLYPHAQEITGTEEGKDALVRAVLSQALIRLCAANPDLPAQGQRADTRSARMIDYLNRNLTDHLTLDDMAKHFYMNKFYLCRVFREATGTTVFSYLQTKRVAMAEQLLQAGVPASEAAERVGFSDYSTFWRAYRKRKGHPPVQDTHGGEFSPFSVKKGESGRESREKD